MTALELERLLGIALATALAGGCDAEPAGTNTSDSEHLEDAGRSSATLRWVGAVEGSDVDVAVLIGGGKARLYFCGGAQSYATATRWFDVAHDGGEHVDFQEDNWRIHAHLNVGGVAGEVELGDGIKHRFNAQRLAPATLAGLYEGKAECGRVGLIVTQASQDTQPTAQGACIGATEQPQQVDPITPISLDAGKIRVQLPGDDDATALLQAATLEPL